MRRTRGGEKRGVHSRSLLSKNCGLKKRIRREVKTPIKKRKNLRHKGEKLGRGERGECCRALERH